VAVDVATRAQAVAPEAADAAAELFERYCAQLLTFCRRELGSRDEAEDAVQATFVNALRALRRGEVPRSETAWLYTIAHNVCRQRLRARMRRGRVELVGEAAERETLAAPTPDRSGDELFGLRDVFESMPPRQREAIVLREWRGLSYAEIGARLGLSQSAVETLLFRARRTLAHGLEQPSRARRLRKAFDLSWLGGLLKGLFGGSAAMKGAAAVAVVVAAAGVSSGAPERSQPAQAPVPARVDVGVAATDSQSSVSVARVRTTPPRVPEARVRATPSSSIQVEVRSAEATPAAQPQAAAPVAPADVPPVHVVVPPAPVTPPVSVEPPALAPPVAVPPVPDVPTAELPLPEVPAPQLPQLPELPIEVPPPPSPLG
jgi:RNA polymerase sigma factor (sigma-70 family)